MSSIEPAIVDDPAQLTADWMTQVLRASGMDVRVRSLRREAVGTGQMAHNERFHLTYDGPRGSAPETVVGKFPALNEESRTAGASGAYRNEVRFYTELAPQLAIRVPRCVYGAVSDDSTLFTLILEDMAPARQGDQLQGASDEQIEAAITTLAGLHGPRWGDPALAEIDWISTSLGEQAAVLVEAVAPIFLERFGDRLSENATHVFRDFAAGVERWLETTPGPRTIVHGDYRLDNLLFASEAGGVPVAAVDWQTVSITSGGRDVGFLLGTSSEAKVRRAHEDRMLEAYRDALRAQGVDRSLEEIRSDYRHGSFQGPFITMLGSMAVGRTDRGDAMFIAMAERSAAAIRDLEALDLIR